MNGPCVLALLFLLASSKFTAEAATCATDSDCSSNEYCNTGNCTCIVNHIDSGGSCVQKPCTNFNPTLDCDHNSDCDAQDNCVCDFGYVADRNICRKECTVATDCGSDVERACIDRKCACKATFTGDGETCNPTTCSSDNECGTNQYCNGGFCACVANTEIDGLECVRKNCINNASSECVEKSICRQNPTDETLQCYCAIFHYVNGSLCAPIHCTDQGGECGENAYCDQGTCVCDTIDESTGMCKSGANGLRVSFSLSVSLPILLSLGHSTICVYS